METTGTEQYAIFFKHNRLKSKDPIHSCGDEGDSKGTIHLYDDMKDNLDHFSRDPGYAIFCHKDFEFVIITCHLDATHHTAYETERLDDVYEAVKFKTDNPNIIVLGDFNLEDGPDDIAFRHYGLLDKVNYPEMEAVLDSTWDTTVAGKEDETTFDNILFDARRFELKKWGVHRFDDKVHKRDKLRKGYDDLISNHYPVWATFKIPEVDDEDE